MNNVIEGKRPDWLFGLGGVVKFSVNAMASKFHSAEPSASFDKLYVKWIFDHNPFSLGFDLHARLLSTTLKYSRNLNLFLIDVAWWRRSTEQSLC